MKTLNGKAVFGGIARGPLYYHRQDETTVLKRTVSDTKAELERYELAREQATAELDDLYKQAISKVGENEASIFLIHKMLLSDDAFCKTIKRRIEIDCYSADYAVALTARDFAMTFTKMTSDYFKGRATDIKDVSDRLIRHIQDKQQKTIELHEKVILCADDLYPSETMQLDLSNVLGIVTCYGSTNSHTAILARTMNIPAIIGVGAGDLSSMPGKAAVLDGFNGRLFVEPDEETSRQLDTIEEEEAKKKELLKRFKGRKNVTLDGTEIEVFANIGGMKDIANVHENDAGGVGLFRSEFLFLGRSSMPDEEEQFYNYRQVLEQMKGKTVIIRTMDAGADKNISYFGLSKEANPALGVRSIRLCLMRPEMFKTQLRALLRASMYGKLAIMLPLIVDMEEIHRAKALIEEAKTQLRARSQPFREDIKIGIMIETPAAAILSDELAQEVDFFSIGTNDLEQYVMAVDRQNLLLENYFEEKTHRALLRFMAMVCDNAHRFGIPVGVCGELGADLNLTEEFLKMGIDEISVSPSLVLPLRQRIRAIKLDERKQLKGQKRF